jgi:acetyltransferase
VSRRNLEHLFNPSSVALIGASDRPHSIGATVMHNLLHGGFAGPVWPVNLRHSEVGGAHAYRSVAQLPGTPDLAVLCTPAVSVPGLIAELGRLGTRAAIVISAGLEQTGGDGQSLGSAMLQAAEPFTLRILGPNCIGLLVPGIGLNASFAHCGASAGNLAFVAQSGALTTAMLDWARTMHIGFSHFVSLGNAADIDFGDLLDYLGRDPNTRAILLYIESIRAARKFMSAARTAARNKPVIVVKSGRTGESARAAQSHSGALAGSDAVYEAAFRRAGVLRVGTTRELFDAAEVLSRLKPYIGPRLAIVSNGGGPGVMATDALIGGGGQLVAFSPDTLGRLDCLMPGTLYGNPLDIGGDALPERYLAALKVVLEDPNVDALLVIHAPTAVASVAEVAAACGPLLTSARCPTLACWLGGEEGASAASLGAVPAYSTPEEAVGAFLHVVNYQQRQALLTEVPASISEAFQPNLAAARAIVAGVLAAGRSVLTEPEAKDVLAAYGIPVVQTRIVREIDALPSVAAALGYPVALKILSPDISHKSDVGGVALNLATDEELQQAARAMLARCRELQPDARMEGFTVQEMIRRGGAHELIAGIAVDATFGPTILFGQGGTAVEVIGDRALALPPLNATLARDLISQTRVQRLLCGYRDHPRVDMPALELALVKLSQLAADLPEILELDINPLLADQHGVLALDARIRVAASQGGATDRLAIRPYPVELEQRVEFQGGPIRLRPLRPEDFAQHQRFLARVTTDDMRTRFFAAIRELPQRDLAHLTQLDYEREMAFIAVAAGEGGSEETLGVVRACTDPDNVEAEFAVLVRSDLKGQGLGALLLEKLIRYCRGRNTQRLVGQALAQNVRMLQLAQKSGFHLQPFGYDLVEMKLVLQGDDAQNNF